MSETLYRAGYSARFGLSGWEVYEPPTMRDYVKSLKWTSDDLERMTRVNPFMQRVLNRSVAKDRAL